MRNGLVLGGFADRAGARVVGAGEQQAAFAYAVGEVHERLLVGLGRPVVVQVVGLDVGDDRDLGDVLEEGALVFVRLDHANVAFAPGGVSAEVD